MRDFPKIDRPTFTTPRPAATMPVPFQAKALRRRMLMFKEASELLPYLPQKPGESTHAIMTGRYDLMVLLAAVLERYGGKCPLLRIATLAFSRRNVSELVDLLHSGQVERLSLLCSDFFRDLNKNEYADACRAREDYSERWRLAATRTHCKVACVELADGRRLVIEGSANLRTNSYWEQLAFIMDAELHDWHSAWIEEAIARHEHDEWRTGGTGEAEAGPAAGLDA